MSELALLTKGHTQHEAVMLQASIGLAGHFLAVNTAWQRLLGWSAAELMALPFTERIHPDDLDNVIAAIHHLHNGGPQTSFRCRFRRRDGVYVRLIWQAEFQCEQFVLKATVRLG